MTFHDHERERERIWDEAIDALASAIVAKLGVERAALLPAIDWAYKQNPYRAHDDE